MTRLCRFGVGSCSSWSVVASLALGTAASAQLRVVNWNVTNYGGAGARDADFQTAVYGVVPSGLDLAGASMSPDIIIGEEFTAAGGVSAFRNLLNTAPGSPGDWAAAPFIDGPDTDNAFFYRTSKVTYIRTVLISQVTGSTSLPPRNTHRFDVRLNGYADVPAAYLALYATHMKSGTASTDQSRRLLEANKIRDNANGLDTNGPGTALPGGYNFILGGDFNIQSSTQAAYQRLVQSETINLGRFFDPINTPGNWNNNGAFRFVHTQDPAVQMDDRHDQLLLGASLLDGQGFEYVGNAAIPYSTTTWNDPNHSYLAWGNDGTSFDQLLKVTGNTMVGAAIAQSLIDTAAGLGHLPVLLDLRVPPKIDATVTIDFGNVALNAPAEQALIVTNAADTGLWTAPGVSDLTYTLSASPGFGAPVGVFAEPAGGSSNLHLIAMDTTTPGPKSGQVVIASNSIDEPARLVTLVGNVVSCPADFNGDGFLSADDFDAYVVAFETGDPAADFDGDGFISGDDFDAFVAAFESGC